MRKGVNGRAKGSSGEREFCRWLKEAFDIDVLPTRNLEQTREGGADILDVPPFCFEVKRVEYLSLDTWWLQVIKAAREYNDSLDSFEWIPVVAFRQNNRQWEFLISAKNIGLEHGFVRLQSLRFVQWARVKLSE